MLEVKYLGENPTLVRSFGKKIEVKKGDIVKVNEQEYTALRGSYKNLFEFSKEEDKKADEEKAESKKDKKNKKGKKDKKVEEVIEEVVEVIETPEVVEEVENPLK